MSSISENKNPVSKWAVRIFGVLVVVGIILILTVFRNDLVQGLAPVAIDIKKVPDWVGYIILTVAMFILQFPPLFGSELLMLFCGFVYGLWPGFGIVTIGMLAGETALFFVARYMNFSYIERKLKSNEMYTGLTAVINESGAWMIFLIRLSALPSHFTTLLFGFMRSVSFRSWSIAGFLSAPKTLPEIYLGASYIDLAFPVETPYAKLVSDIAFSIKIAVSIALAGYLYYRYMVIMKARKEEMTKDPFDDNVPLTQRKEGDEAFLPVKPKPYMPLLYSALPKKEEVEEVSLVEEPLDY